MSEFADKCDLLDGLRLDEWWKQMNTTEEVDNKERRHAEINESDIEEMENSRNEAGSHTYRQTMWSIRCFQTWCAEKNLAIDLKSGSKKELNQALRQFYATVRNGKGEPYGFSSFIGLRAGLNRYINDPPISRSCCLLKDPEFITSNKVFVSVVKKLRREGRDKTSHSQMMTEADFQKIRNSWVLNPNTPEGLVNKVWFDVQLHMGRRAKGGNRHLKPESFIICQDKNGRKYATLSLGDCTKNHKDAGEKNKNGLRGFMLEQPGNPLCPVASLEKYLSLLPPNPPAFYLHPLRTNYTVDLWYTREPMGLNFLGSMLPRICKAAGTKTIYTNLSLRNTTVQRRCDAGLEAREPMSLMAHKCESSLRSHCHPNCCERRSQDITPASGTAQLKRTFPESNTPVPAKKNAKIIEGYLNNCVIDDHSEQLNMITVKSEVQCKAEPQGLQIGFIGAGNMAFGIAQGILVSGAVSPENVKVSAPSSNHLGRFEEMGAAVTHANAEVVSASRLVFLAVKPHLVPAVLQEVASLVTREHIIVSVAAGVTIATVEALLPPESVVLRLMPNLPCLVQEGALLFARGSRAVPEHATLLRSLLGHCGLVEEGPESWIDAHTGLSGSGVAFVYLFAEALAEGGVKMGMPSALAHRIAAQTVLGAGRMLRDSEKHPAQLRADVCTPGGTTIFGLHELEKGGLRAAVMGAVEAATDRARDLGKK